MPSIIKQSLLRKTPIIQDLVKQ